MYIFIVSGYIFIHIILIQLNIIKKNPKTFLRVLGILEKPFSFIYLKYDKQ
jgi:hypothetical protein